jgi:small conductance mechanosensitive channel
MIDELREAFSKLLIKLESWLDTAIVMLPNFVVALIVIIVFFVSTNLLKKLLFGGLSRISQNTAVNKLIVSLTNYTIIVFGIFIALSVLNLDKTVTSLLAGLGIAGLAISLAFKEAASNFIAGIYMALKSPINVGDLIKHNDHYGKVKKIGLRATTIRSLQGQDIVVPNHLVIDNPYTHFTVNNVRRIDLEVGISYGDNLEKAEQVTIEAIEKINYRIHMLPVELYYTEFGDSSINFLVYYWIRFEKETDYLKALSDGIKNIKKAYEKHGITITFPIRTLDFGIKGGKNLSQMLMDVENQKNN